MNYSELKRLAKAANAYAEEDWHTPERLFIAMEKSDAEFVSGCSPFSVLALIAENERLGLESHNTRIILVDMVESRDQLKAENEALRLALESCADELEGQVIQCYHGIPVEDMHPVTRRAYDRDMSGVVEARAAMKKAVKDD